ncbi:MAG: outer membrane protein assembly factor BamD [Planctomycetota bacterium]|nr:outer membrane protein assembly factor BamD [Planctomycetota bacterium]
MKKCLAAILVLAFVFNAASEAAWIWNKDTGFYNPKYAVKESAEAQLKYGMDFFEKKKYEHARKLFKRLIQFFPDSKLNAEAQYMIAECFYLDKDYWRAYLEYKILVKEYPRHERIQDVIKKQYRIGHLLCNGTKRKWMGIKIKAEEKGMEVLESVILLDSWDELADDALFEIGKCQYRKKQYESAEKSFSKLVQDYPSSAFVGEAQYLKARCSYDQIQGLEYAPDLPAKAKRDFSILKEDYPEAEVTKDAESKISQMAEESAKSDFEKAHYYLKNKKYTAASIYFRAVARNYPDTNTGQKAARIWKVLESLEPPK